MGERCWIREETQNLQEQYEDHSKSRVCYESVTEEEDHHVHSLLSSRRFDNAELG